MTKPSGDFPVETRTAAEWNANPQLVLQAGQVGTELDTGLLKIGDGVSSWAALPVPGTSPLPSANFLPASGIGWRRGLNNMLNSTRPARILCIGDSTVRGFGDSVDAKGWPAGLATTLFGRGFQSVRGLVIPEFQRSGQAVDPRISLVGANWTLFSSAGSGVGWGNRDVLWQGTVAAGGMTYTPTVTGTPAVSCDRFDIYWQKSASGGTFQASIDGQAAVNINTAGTPAGVGKTTVIATNGVQTNHVLTLNNVTVNTVFVGGIEAYNGVTPQVLIGNAGVNGTFAADWAATSAVFPALTPAAWVAAYAPDLLIIGLGVNDADSGISAASYTSSLASFVSAAMTGGGSTLLLSPIPTNPAQASGNTVLEAQYSEALRALAASNGWMMVDMFNRWGGPSGYAVLSPKGWYFDNIHPDPIGYWDIATTMATALDNF